MSICCKHASLQRTFIFSLATARISLNAQLHLSTHYTLTSKYIINGYDWKMDCWLTWGHEGGLLSLLIAKNFYFVKVLPLQNIWLFVYVSLQIHPVCLQPWVLVPAHGHP